MKRPGVLVLSELGLKNAVAHGEATGARPVTLFPKGGTEHLGNGQVHRLTVREFHDELVVFAPTVLAKGEGMFWTAGASKNGRKRDTDCAAIGWLALDCDTGGDWVALLQRLNAHCAYFSPS